MDAATGRLIRERANDRCEYCRARQSDENFPFEIEHVIARQHGGDDTPANLALACMSCNRHKGPNLAGVDPETGTVEVVAHDGRRVASGDEPIASRAVPGFEVVPRVLFTPP